MTTKDLILEQCDKGIRSNKRIIGFNFFMVAVNLLICFGYFVKDKWGFSGLHFLFMLLHLYFAYLAYNLMNKWQNLKDTYDK